MIVERQSVVDAPAEGIMAMPRGAKDLTVDTVPVGTPVGRCWLRLFGIVPFDYDHLTIAELRPGRGFDEQSTMLSMRSWRHERTVEPDGDAKTVVRDRLTFTLRAPLRPLTPVVARGIAALFGHRHRRLQRHFAGIRH